MCRFILLGWLMLSALGCWAQNQDPDYTYGTLLQASDGNLYGVRLGPDSDSGFFSQTPDGTLTILNSRVQPYLCLEGPDGNIYAKTIYTTPVEILKLTLSGEASTFATLPGGKTAGCPVMASDGNYYGASADGGAHGQGYLYEVTPAGVVTDFYDFNGTTDGGGTSNTPLEGSDGYLYLYNSGNLLKYSRSSGLTVIPESSPVTGALVEGPDGNFYGLNQGTSVESLEQVQPSGTTNPIYQTPVIGYGTLEGPFADGDGSLSMVQRIPFTTEYCGGGYYLSFFPVGLSGVPGSQYFQIGAPYVFNGYYYIDSYSASSVFLSGTGTYYGTTVDQIAEQPDSCSGYEALSIFGQAPTLLPTPPIQMTLTKTHILPGGSADLSWQVNNAFSKTMQQCYGYGGLAGKVALSGNKSFASVAAGVHTYSIVCGGTEVGIATLTAASTVQLTLSSPSTVLTPDMPAVLTAQIANVGTPGPTGPVTFLYGSRVLGSAAVNSAGAAILTVPTNGLPPGTYNLTASYAGDANYGPGTAAPYALTMLPGKGTTTLALSPSSLIVQEGFSGILLEAVPTGTVSAQPPSGNVSLYYGSRILQTAALGSDGNFSGYPADSVLLGVGLEQLIGVPAGNYTLIAKYAGDPWNSPATSNPVTVTLVTLAVTMTATPNPAPQGSSVTLTAQTTGSLSIPTGTVTFYIGAQALGTSPVNGSGGASVTLTPDALAPGTYQLNAHYGGNSTYVQVSSPAITLVVQ
jgi:hypothetical protein